MIRYLALLALPCLLASCGAGEDDGPITVSVIGRPPTMADPNREPLDAPSAALLSATAQGLVRFDGTGQIEPGLAIRWDVSDDGLYYTFRLADGLGMDAEQAARRLRAAIGRSSRNPLQPLFGSVEKIVAVTPEVIEIRLVAPQADLLELLAQPELSLAGRSGGTGPFAIAIREPAALVLAPVTADDAENEDAEEALRAQVRLRSDRAGIAITRFLEKRADLVLGGTFADLPIVRQGKPSAKELRFDPAAGLFGLAIVEPTGFLADAANRRALSMAIDRDRIARAFAAPNWRSTTTIVPPGTPGLIGPASPDWVDTSFDLRRMLAERAVTTWVRVNEAGKPPTLRVAVPPTPGGRLLFGLIAANWRSIGVTTQAVAMDDDADLRLVDAVAPTSSPVWYLARFRCAVSRPCSETADAALDAARAATSIEERDARLAEADERLAETVPFIPIAQPLRWSLVAPRLQSFQDNVRAVHPLNHLLAPRR